MAINPVNSTAPQAAQLVQQATRQPPVQQTSDTDDNRASRAAEATQQTQAKTVEQSRPVVNTQGQTTGQILNTTA